MEPSITQESREDRMNRWKGFREVFRAVAGPNIKESSYAIRVPVFPDASRIGMGLSVSSGALGTTFVGRDISDARI